MGAGLAEEGIQTAPPPHEPGRLRVFVAGEGRFTAHHLPDSGRVTIGRDPSCELHVDDPSVAPRHAVLSMGPPVRIEDLGSGLLTSIRQDRVEPGEPEEVAPGDILHVGGVILMVEGRGTAPPRRILPHGYFEMRLEEECHRAGRYTSTFALVRISCDPGYPSTAIEEDCSQRPMRAGAPRAPHSCPPRSRARAYAGPSSSRSRCRVSMRTRLA